jgi:hypothetical protein
MHAWLWCFVNINAVINGFKIFVEATMLFIPANSYLNKNRECFACTRTIPL